MERSDPDLADRAERALRHLLGSERFLDTLPIGIYCCDSDGIIRGFNRRAAALWGLTPRVGGSHEDFCSAQRLFHPDGRPLPPRETPMAQVLRTGQPVRDRKILVERPDGAWMTALVNIDPLIDEGGALVGAVNCFQDITAQHASEIEAAHLAAIVTSSSDAIVSKTLDGIVRTWNDSAVRIFGYEAAEMIGRSITRVIPPELQDEEEEILSRLRRGERLDHFETVRMTKDGRRIDMSLTISPVRDKAGTVIGASKIARDITERKRAEHLQELLVGELDHRVKNTLATVQSIANQTVRFAKSPAEFVSSFSARLQALAHAHDLLTDNAWRGADIQALLRDEVFLGGIEDDRITLSGPSVTLEPQAALHLALLVHELGINARKYGSLSAPAGRLAVEWSVRTKDGRAMLLQWRESGGPPVRAPAARGFGTTLIERGLTAIGGEACIHYRADGVTCALELPLPERADAGDRGIAALVREGHPRAAAPGRRRSAVAGRRVLVVDDEPLIAMDVIDMISEAGCVPVGPAATVAAAMALAQNADIDVALLDANLGGSPVDEIAAALVRRNIPFAFLTGYTRDSLPPALRQATVVTKPFGREDVLAALEQLLTRDETVVRFAPRGA